MKNATSVDTSQFVKKDDSANLKSDIDRLDIDELKTVPGTNGLKSIVDELDVGKLKLVPVDFLLIPC